MGRREQGEKKLTPDSRLVIDDKKAENASASPKKPDFSFKIRG
jgi:hypothetical protein